MPSVDEVQSSFGGRQRRLLAEFPVLISKI